MALQDLDRTNNNNNSSNNSNKTNSQTSHSNSQQQPQQKPKPKKKQVENNHSSLIAKVQNHAAIQNIKAGYKAGAENETIDQYYEAKTKGALDKIAMGELQHAQLISEVLSSLPSAKVSVEDVVGIFSAIDVMFADAENIEKINPTDYLPQWSLTPGDDND